MLTERWLLSFVQDMNSPSRPAIFTVQIQLMMYGSKVILPRLHSYELLFLFYLRTDGVAVFVVFRSLKKQSVIYSRAPYRLVSYIRIFRKYSTCNYILLVFILFAVNVQYTVTAFGHLITLHSLVIKPRVWTLLIRMEIPLAVSSHSVYPYDGFLVRLSATHPGKFQDRTLN